MVQAYLSCTLRVHYTTRMPNQLSLTRVCCALAYFSNRVNLVTQGFEILRCRYFLQRKTIRLCGEDNEMLNT